MKWRHHEEDATSTGRPLQELSGVIDSQWSSLLSIFLVLGEPNPTTTFSWGASDVTPCLENRQDAEASSASTKVLGLLSLVQFLTDLRLAMGNMVL